MDKHLQSSTSPRDTLLQLINAYQLSQLVYVAAELNIAGLLNDGPKRYQELAQVLGIDPNVLFRCLRALAAAGVFRQLNDDRFELSALSKSLCRDAPGSLRAWAIYTGQQAYPTWGHLLQSIQTGKNAFEQLHGMDVWEYRAQHPSYGQVFDAAMSESMFHTAMTVVTAYDFSRFGHIVDVGGGQGLLLATILKVNPSVCGVLFDQAQVVQGASNVLRQAGVLDRCEIVDGSFFDIVPRGGDAYLLSRVINDWDDIQSSRILKNCRQAMEKNQTLLLIQRVIEPDKPRVETLLLALHMMIMAGGHERTKEEYRTLLRAAGFELTNVVQTRSALCVIEAKSV